MLLRLTLAIAILAGLAALYFVHFPLNEKINIIVAEREDARAKEQQARDAEAKAKSAERKAKDDFAAAQKELADKTEALNATVARLTEQETRANRLNEELTTVSGERNIAQQDLAAWKALGIPIDQVKNLKVDLAKITEERDALGEERKILARKNDDLQTKVNRWLGTSPDPVMTNGLKGSIIAVDPRYDFVVLDIGGNQGVVPNGKLLVNRNGKLVAKLRVTRVEPNRSIANVMENQKYGDVMEGDQVIY